jgi:hypothetical protein
VHMEPSRLGTLVYLYRGNNQIHPSLQRKYQNI